jgi:hypothetical protein
MSEKTIQKPNDWQKKTPESLMTDRRKNQNRTRLSERKKQKHNDWLKEIQKRNDRAKRRQKPNDWSKEIQKRSDWPIKNTEAQRLSEKYTET